MRVSEKRSLPSHRWEFDRLWSRALPLQSRLSKPNHTTESEIVKFMFHNILRQRLCPMQTNQAGLWQAKATNLMSLQAKVSETVDD